MKNRPIRIVLGAFAAAAALAAAAQPSPPTADRPLRVLFIGSSLTYVNGLPGAFANVVNGIEPAHVIQVEEVTLPASGLRRHWDGRARDRVAEARWDYVVLQPGFDQMPDKHVALFDQEIRKAGAKTILFVTWSYRGDSARQKELNEAFAKAAAETGVAAAPIGPAWELAEKKHRGIGLYQIDNLHPSQMGTYVAACVIYSTIMGRPVPTADATGATAAAREAAWEAVQAWRGPSVK